MKAPEALKAIFAEAAWQLDPHSQSQALLASTVALENFTVSFFAYNEDELFVSTKIAALPTDPELRVALLKQAGTMCAALWQQHRLNLSVTEEQLNLELVVYTEREDFLTKVSAFLDDCDYFVANLTAVKAGQGVAQNATADAAAPVTSPFAGLNGLWG